MAIWQNNKFTKWQVDEISSWQNYISTRVK